MKSEFAFVELLNFQRPLVCLLPLFSFSFRHSQKFNGEQLVKNAVNKQVLLTYSSIKLEMKMYSNYL